jgi:hypothetical protein
MKCFINIINGTEFYLVIQQVLLWKLSEITNVQNAHKQCQCTADNNKKKIKTYVSVLL